MDTFGDLLKKYRYQSRDPQSKRPLTQERLAELLSLQAEIEGYSGSTVSNWERSVNQIRRDDRHILVALIAVLHQAGGIHTQEQAKKLLFAGNYRPLDEQESIQIDPIWKFPNVNKFGDIPSPDEQEAMLPASSYTRLFGVEGLIQEALEQLTSPHSSRLIMLTGVSGLGKTAVADAVARRAIHQHLFAHVVWISNTTDKIDSSLEMGFHSVINGLCHQLLPEGIHNENPAKILTRLRFKLRQYPHLVIIDNLEVPNETLNLLKQLQGIIGEGKCFLTSRHHPPMGVEATPIPMPELSLKDAAALLNYQAQLAGFTDFKQTDVEELYAVVGGHPFALRLIPRLARMHALSEIVSGWQNEQPGYIANVYQSVFDDLWQTLRPTEKQIMSVMPLIARNGGTLAYLQAICELPKETVWPALTKLVECCLIEPQGNLHEQRYGIHRLTEQYVLNRLKSELDGFPFSVELIQNALSFWRQYLDDLSDKELHRLDSEQENIFKSLQFSLVLSEGKVTPVLQKAWQDLFDHLFRYIEQRGFATTWLPLMQAIVEKFSGYPPVCFRLLNRLGELYRLNHQLPEAIEIHQRVLKFAQQAEETEEIAQAYLNLGNDYLLNKQYEAAAEHGVLALNQFDQLELSGKGRAATLNLLGMSAFMQGQLKPSGRYLHEAIAIWRSLNYRPELARTLRNLALNLQAQKDSSGVEKCYVEAKRALAKTASELDRILIYLAEGTFHFEQNRYRKAEAVFKRVDLPYLKKSGRMNYLAHALNNLGNVAFIREHYAEAEQLLRESIQNWQRLAEPLEMANSLGRLGDVLVVQDKGDEAWLVFTDAAKLLDKYDNDNRMVHLKNDLIEALAQLKGTRKEG